MTTQAFYRTVMMMTGDDRREIAKRATAGVLHALRDGLTVEELHQVVASAREARWMTLAVFAVLKEQLSPGEGEDVRAQLPRDVKEVWAGAQAEG
jgi:uncharacterized protein (DUF2267 family)